MDIATLVDTYPSLWHMAEDGAWPLILEHGLLSTSALLDLFEVEEQNRRRIESMHRPESVTISSEHIGVAVVRDQKPMSDQGLRRCLPDYIAPQEWYELLNQHTFFWVTEQRLLRLLNARAYRERPHTVLTLNTASIVGEYRDRIRLSAINSGCTKPFPHPRDERTFLRIEDYPFEARKRRGLEPVVELAVFHGVADMERHVELVRRMQGDQVLETL
jgi:hypothetical protein